MARSHEAVHRDVVTARHLLLLYSLASAWMVWTAVSLPSLTLVILGSLVPLLVSGLVRRRWLRNSTTKGAPPARAAWIPVVCVIVAVLGYGMTLSSVHEHYYAKKSAAYLHRLHVEGQRAAAESAVFKRKIKAVQRETRKLARAHRPPTVREVREQLKFNRIIGNGGGDVRAKLILLERAGFAKGGRIATLVAGLALVTHLLPLSLPSATPSVTELPPWFGRLGSFFTVATQLLAGLIIVLVFGRWRTGASEAMFRTAMPVAVIGVVAGLGGNLPSNSRTLQAILLGPVLAGLAGAVGGLLVAATTGIRSD